MIAAQPQPRRIVEEIEDLPREHAKAPRTPRQSVASVTARSSGVTRRIRNGAFLSKLAPVSPWAAPRAAIYRHPHRTICPVKSRRCPAARPHDLPSRSSIMLSRTTGEVDRRPSRRSRQPPVRRKPAPKPRGRRSPVDVELASSCPEEQWVVVVAERVCVGEAHDRTVDRGRAAQCGQLRRPGCEGSRSLTSGCRLT